MLDGELARPEDDRIDAVVIVTPNDVHYPVAKAAVEAGFHVVCDKPLVHTSEQAQELVDLVARSGVVFGVTYNYTGYPLVRHARDMVANGDIGELRKVVVQYSQGWLATLVEATGNKQAEWRTDPARSGIAGAMGDIGSHAENLAATITGRNVTHVSADIATVVEGRLLDDDAAVLLRLEGGVRGLLVASQIETGTRTTCASGCTAPRARCTGARRIRTSSCTRRRAAPAGTCGAATTTCRRRRRRRRASRRAIRRATSRPSRTCTSASSRPSARSRRAASWTRSRGSSRRWRTARGACASSSA